RLTLVILWRGFCRDDGRWFVPAGVAAGLAVMAKGPVGFVLPAAVVGVFLLLTRRLGELWDRRLMLGLVAFGVVAFPWYIWVGIDTKADFLRGFFLTHNVNRFLSPMENHGGPVWYYPVVLLVGFAPWSAFLALTAWSSFGEWREGRRAEAAPPAHIHLFLWCWVGVTVAFFTVSSTKLPNYVLPVYPALALLTARLFDRWRRGELALPAWPLPVGLACLALVGVATALGLLVAGGAIRVPALRGRQLAGLEGWAFVGLFPVAGR